MKKIDHKINNIKKILAVIVILSQILELSGCGVLSTVDPGLKTAPKIGSAIIADTSSQNMRNSVSHDMTRFYIEGTNAFYIPDGLENDPRDIRKFDVLDYTEDGEFIYHFITPAYITDEEVCELKTSARSEGDVSTNSIKEPDRTGWPKSDAELLMAYKPETGHYRVLEAKGYKLEWDPAREDTPDFFTTPILADGRKKGLIFMKERGFACKIPDRQEYVITDMNGIGTVYNINGEKIYVIDYSNDISYQQKCHQISVRDGERSYESLLDLDDEKDQGFDLYRKTYENRSTENYESLKLVITDVAFNKEYCSYISCSSYTGSSPFEPGVFIGGFTFVVYKTPLANSDSEISEYVSVNLNAEKQNELWSSLDGKYFNSKEEMENEPGYSMEKIKTTGDLADNFSPFTSNPTTVSEDASFIVGAADFLTMGFDKFDSKDIDRLLEAYKMSSDDSDMLSWYMKSYDSESSRKRNKLLEYWRDEASVEAKRGFRSAHGLYFDKLLSYISLDNRRLENYVDILKSKGLIPRMGKWNEAKKINESQLNEGEYTPQSLHILRILSKSVASDIPYITQVDPIDSEAGDSRHSTMEEDKVTAVPISYAGAMSRTTWYRSGSEAADRRNKYKAEHPELAGTVDSIYEILSSEDISENVITKILGKSTGTEEEAASEAIEYINELIEKLPDDDVQYVLSICAGYADETIEYEEKKYPEIYALKFPEGANAIINKNVDLDNVAGKLKGVSNGTLIASDDIYSMGDLSQLRKFIGVKNIVSDTTEAPGSPNELGELKWKKPETGESVTYYTYRTSLGIKFYLCNAYGGFSPVEFTGEVDDIWKKPLSNGVEYTAHTTEGFIPYEKLLTSSGYTKDTENRTSDAVEEVIESAGGTTDNSILDKELLEESKNKRYTGSIASADSFVLIGSHTALICALNGGTRILNLKTGTVIDESGDGSFYRGFQVGNSKHYKLIGFDTNKYTYISQDLPMAKLYDKDFEPDVGDEVDEKVIDSVCGTLQQMAKDFLYRQYRTTLDDSDNVVRIEMPESELEENISEEKLFASGNADDLEGEFCHELLRLEKLYGIDSDPEYIKNYLIYLRKQAAAIKPAITKIYLIAGAASLSTSAKREEAYWKNLDARITMADSLDGLKNILVEIRMHPDAAENIPAAQKEKYRGYKPILDYTSEQGKVTFKDDDVAKAVSEDKIKESYREDVLNDIKADFEKDYPEANFDEKLEELLNKVNPDNLLLKKEDAREEFIDISNKGLSSLSEEPYEKMKERMLKAMPNIETVWEMEKLIISEKVLQPKFEKYKSDFEKFEEEAMYTKSSKRAALMRKQEFYKEIIGDLKADSYVKEFLAGKRETWEDYIREIIITTGAGSVKDENGLVEDSPYNNAINEWRKLSEEE